MPEGTETMAALWRGVVVLRLACAGVAAAAIAIHHDGYLRPQLGWVVLVAMLAWTAVVAVAYSHDAGRRLAMVGADLAVTLVLLATSAWTLSPGQLADLPERTPLLTTVWASGPVLAAAVHLGRVGGVAAGVVVSLANGLVRGAVSVDVARDTVLLVGAGFVLGLASVGARRAADQARRAARMAAATSERERLARSVHERVLEVLARVRAGGGELDGEAAELARRAGEQEAALRALLSAPPRDPAGTGDADLGAALRLLAGPQLVVSVPADPVPLPSADVEELVAVVTEALSGTARRAGPDATPRLLLQDLGDEVVLTARQPTAGLSGPAGVPGSIRGRVADLGATLSLDGTPDGGAGWQLRLARTRGATLR